MKMKSKDLLTVLEGLASSDEELENWDMRGVCKDAADRIRELQKRVEELEGAGAVRLSPIDRLRVLESQLGPLINDVDFQLREYREG